MSKVIEFPYHKISNPLADKPERFEMDHEADVTREVVGSIIRTLADYQYTFTTEDKLFEDIGILYNIIYAALCRCDNIDHPWHEMMDEITRTTIEVKKGNSDG